jgi:hypothetical protein
MVPNMQQLKCVAHYHEVVMNSSVRNEGTLIWQDKVVHVGCQAQGKNLSDQLAEAMYEANWSKVFDVVSCLLFT